MKKIATVAAAALLLSGCSAMTAAMAPESPLPGALDACGLNSGRDAQLGDDGASLMLNGSGESSSGLQIESVACVLDELAIPDSVVARIDSTRALDGTQTASWEDLSATWTYHPDDGIDLILEFTPE